ncbi:hypothetical protein LLE49_20000 [Alicyclobacillus tolerans]|uniref:hypothetical protein n=1 Tax=Alicyclobacillus tolerans TaxID=90970 RepID=UPI001F467E2C|nr:hypothetical protein [Alicyclobacillus tolerans]MCF8567007.1 hypothetical protein [Alicyclobacillus tolerans]
MLGHKAAAAGLAAILGGWIGTVDHLLSPWIWVIIVILAVDLLRHTRNELSLLKQVFASFWAVLVVVVPLMGKLPSILDVHGLLQAAVFAFALAMLYTTFPKWFAFLGKKLGIKAFTTIANDITKVEKDITQIEKDLIPHHNQPPVPSGTNVVPPSGTDAGKVS